MSLRWLPRRASAHFSSTAQGGSPDDDKPVAPMPPPPSRWWILLVAVGGLLTIWLLFGGSVGEDDKITYSEFLVLVDEGKVDTVTIDSEGRVDLELEDGTQYRTAIPTALDQEALTARLEEAEVEIEAVAPSTSFLSIVLSFLPLLLFIGIFIWIGRRAGRSLAGIGGIGRSKAKLFDEERPPTRFSDVAGYEGVKREVGEVVDFLKEPGRYSAIGARGPQGVLLVGPPGTGKTLMARAVAGEARVPFLSVTGSSFVEMFVGVGASRVRDLFAEARKRSPAIIFIDEIDAIGQRRGAAVISNDEREQTLNQLLAEMDGFEPTEGIVVVAATNRPETLDPALLRPGRFDRQVVVPLPTQAERHAILGVHSRGKALGTDVDLGRVARGTPGFSGADLANLVNEAAIFAIRAGRQEITAADFNEARDRVMLGRRESSNALLPSEKRIVAVHEAGHALIAALSDEADPVERVTILPAGQALGVTHQLPLDERRLYSESYLRDSLAVRLGGRAAELIVFGEGSTGAANDLVSATDVATRMVRDFGFSSELGPVSYGADSVSYLGGQPVQPRTYAEDTQRVIDREVARLLREAEQDAKTMLEKHRPVLDALTERLLQDETLDGRVVYELVGRSPLDGHEDLVEPTAASTETHPEGGRRPS